MNLNNIEQENYASINSISNSSLYKIVAIIITLLLLIFFVFIIFAPWQQTAYGTGKVVAFSPNERQQNISAPVDGRLGKWFVHEGTEVNAGDPIVEIIDVDPAFKERLALERKALELKLTAARHAVALADKNVQRQKILHEEGISSTRAYEQARFEYAKHLSEVTNAEIELVKINGKIARQENQLVRAPKNGIILKRLAGEQSVLIKTGDAIAELVPHTNTRTVELWLNGNDLPLIEKNQMARLQFEGWPAIQFSGWPSVAVGTFPGKVILIDAAINEHGKIRVLIAPANPKDWPDKKYLIQGTRAKGWILLGQVPMWFEIWRRFNGFPPVKASSK